jgi:hypothetical protein
LGGQPGFRPPLQGNIKALLGSWKI